MELDIADIFKQIKELQESQDKVQFKLIGLEQSEELQLKRFNEQQRELAIEQQRLDYLEQDIVK